MASIADVYVTVIPETSKLAPGIKRALRDVENVKINVDADTDQVDRDLDRVRTSQERKRLKLKADFDDSDLRGKLDILGKQFDGVGAKFVSAFKWNAGFAAVGTLPAMATAVANVAGALQQLAGAGAALPGVFAGVASSVGTAALGLQGVGDAIEAVNKAADGTQASVDAANKALAELSPNAADAVKTITGLKGTFTDLRDIASQNLFAGFSGNLRDMVGNLLPSVTQGVNQISFALNQNLTQAMKSMGSGSSQSLLDRIFGNTADAQSRLTTAIDPIIHAFEVLAAAGSDALPRLADALGAVAERFNNFITAADADGRLSTWINDGLTGFTHLGNALLNIGKSFTAITQAAGGDGGLLAGLESLTEKMAVFLNSTAGQDALQQFFAKGRDMLAQLRDVAVEAGPVLSGMWDTALSSAELWLPVIREVLDIINSIPGGAQAVVTAFLAWKTIQGPIALANSLTNIVSLLRTTLPAAAAEGAAAASGSMAGFATTLGGIGALIAGILAAKPFIEDWGDTWKTHQSWMPHGFVGANVLGLGPDQQTGTLPGQAPGQNNTTFNRTGRPNAPVAQGPGSPQVMPSAPGTSAPGTSGGNFYKDWYPSGAPDVQVPGVSNYAPPVVTSGGAGSSGSGTNWDAVAQGESSGNWQTNTGNGYYGGLQFDLPTWDAFKPSNAPWRPDLASKDQQIAAAENLLKSRGPIEGPKAWPNTYQLGAPAGGVPATSASPSSAAMPTTTSTPNYGLPPGTNTGGYGTGTSATFPPWVMALATEFGVTPSTYSGHQESDRNEPGYAPNPQHLNRGIDWSGPPENMERLAAYLATQPGAEQVIYSGKRPYEYVAGQARPGYFAGDLAAHGGHVHSRQSTAIPLPGMTASPLDGTYPDISGVTDLSSYMTGDPTHDKKIRQAGQSVDDSAFRVSQAQAAIDDMNLKGTSTAAERAKAEHDLAVAKREHADAQTDLNTALMEGDKQDKKQKGGPGEQLGKDIVTGMLDVFGFGDLFKDPTDFGLFKLFQGFMGLKPSDVKGGDGASLPAGGGGGGPLGTLLSMIPQPFGPIQPGSPGNAPTPFMPQLGPGGGGNAGIVAPGNIIADPNSPPGVAGPGNQQPGFVADFRGANFGYSQTQVQDQVNSAHLQQVRQPLRALPGP